MPWSNWKTEDHGIKVLGAPAVCSWKEGRLDVFVRTTENRLYHRVYENERWQGLTWTNLADGHAIEASPAAVSWAPNRIDLFAVWDRQVHHRVFQNGTWNAWAENLGGATLDAPAAASGKSLRVEVLVHTTDNRLARRFWDNTVPGGWQNWETIGGGSASLVSAPAVAATAFNRLDCFGRGPSGRLVHAWVQGVIHDDWSEIDTLPIKDAPAVASAVTADRRRVDVFVRGTDDLLKHRVFYTGLRRNEPAGETVYTATLGDTLSRIAQKFSVPLETLKALNPHIPPPDYPVQVGTRVVIQRQESQSIYSDWEPGSSWHNLSMNVIASAPAAAAWWNGNILRRLDCFAQGPNNQLIHTWWK